MKSRSIEYREEALSIAFEAGDACSCCQRSKIRAEIRRCFFSFLKTASSRLAVASIVRVQIAVISP